MELDRCITSLGIKFLKWPNNFFTESDAHSFLYYYIFRSSIPELKRFYHTADNKSKTVLVHREYPTSYRYIKENMELSDRGGRGHYDLVILNPEFITTHSIEEVMAKTYKKVSKNDKEHLLTVIEFKLVVNALSKRMKEEIEKDVKKLNYALDLVQSKTAYMIVFNRYRKEELYQQEIATLGKAYSKIKFIYIESVPENKRHYYWLYINNWRYIMKTKKVKYKHIRNNDNYA